MSQRSFPGPKRRTFSPKKPSATKSYGSLPNLSDAKLPIRPLTAEELLSALGLDGCLDVPPLNLAVICDSREQALRSVEQAATAGERFMALKPTTVKSRALAHRSITMDEIRQLAGEENVTTEVVGLTLLVELCYASPTDLVLGIGQYGQGIVKDLKRQAVKIYPAQAEKFITQAEAEREAKTRPFASEPNAFLLTVFERLYGIRL